MLQLEFLQCENCKHTLEIAFLNVLLHYIYIYEFAWCVYRQVNMFDQLM